MQQIIIYLLTIYIYIYTVLTIYICIYTITGSVLLKIFIDKCDEIITIQNI